MASRALVSGSDERVEQVAQALRDAGADVVTVDDLGRLAEIAQGLEPGSLSCYVQLPVAVQVSGECVVHRVRTFLEGGLLARFDTAAAVLPALSDEAVVVLVGGNTTPEGDSLPDDAAARRSLLNVLAHALRADRAPGRLRVRVLDGGSGPDAIAAAGFGTSPSRGTKLREQQSDLSYEDWRAEVMGMATVQV
jgi:hypothetical protein